MINHFSGGPADHAHVGTEAACYGSGDRMKGRTAVLLVAHGTREPEGRQSLVLVEAAANKRFPGTEVAWSFTSRIVREKLEATGNPMPGPAEALTDLTGRGFNRVAVLPLHLVAGEEFHGLHRAIRERQSPQDRIKIEIGRPLLAGGPDLVRTAEAVIAALPAGRKPGEPVTVMGHGAGHPAGLTYAALAYALKRLDHAVFLATLGAFPNLDDLLIDLGPGNGRVLWLVPFMVAAGRHVREEFDGNRPGSFASVLGQAGFECRPEPKSLVENPAVVEIWLDHLAEAINRLG